MYIHNNKLRIGTYMSMNSISIINYCSWMRKRNSQEGTITT